MFKEIFLFEFKQGLKKPLNYVFAGFLFLLALFIAMAGVGVFDLTEGDSLTHINSAYGIASYLIGTNGTVFGLLNSIIIITIIATAVQKDYQYNLHPLFFTKPISKSSYFFGRFFGAFSIAVLVFCFSIIGLYIGFLAGYGHPSLGPFRFINFIQPFLIFVLPNLLLQGIIYFSLTTFFRNTLISYLFAIIILIIQLSTSVILADIDNKTLASMIDLTGQKAFSQITNYWTPFQQNELLIPFKGELLYNRLLWIGIAILVTAISYYKFSFSQFINPIRFFKKKENESQLIVSKYESLADIPPIRQHSSTWNAIVQYAFLSRYEMRKIIKTPFFIIICALGFVLAFIFIMFEGSFQNSEYYPVTYRMIERVGDAFYFVLVIFIIFYAGTIIWGEKDHKVDELIGVTQVSNTTLFLSKLSGLILAGCFLIMAGCITAIIYQLSSGFYEIDLMQYVVFVLESMVEISIIAALCISVQSIFSNKYAAFFLSLVPILFISIILNRLQIFNPLYDFNSSGAAMPYSDMNGYNDKHFTWMHYKFYWIGIVGVLSIIGILLYHRGKELKFKQRFRLNKTRGKNWMYVFLLGFIIMSSYTGSTIMKENKKSKQYEGNQATEILSAKYEKDYKYLAALPQPRFVAVDVDIDIFPSEKSFKANGIFTIKNKTEHSIDTLVIEYMGSINPQYQYHKLEVSLPHELISNDTTLGVKTIKLNRPMQPGDSTIIEMDMQYAQVGKFTEQESMIVANGAFFNNGNFFSLGYNENKELSSNISRKKYDLPAKERIAKLEDSAARMNNYISHDADWIRFTATVSTEKGQIAIAPGYLQKDWEEKGRHYFQYTMDSPILNFYAFQSAKYEIKKDNWKDVNIEIYYHKGHEYNIDKMIESIKASLSYYTENFGPYQHRQIRIIEFPRYANFAQAFPNTIPYSEGMGFITKTDDSEEKIDMPFYVTAHEVAHQWFAHQVIGAKVQGAEMLSESLSQYAALMVMEQKYGQQAMKKYLKHEMDDYLRSRTFESKKEMPISRVEHQSYIYYAKGSLVFYTLRDYLGADVLNNAIRNFLTQNKFQNPPYTTSMDLIAEIRKVAPDSMQYLITDLFEKITLYENYIIDFEYEAMPDGQYKVKVKVGSAKFYADPSGEDVRVEDHHDFVDIGIYAIEQNKEKELLLQKVLMDAGEKTFEFIVDTKPSKAGIDPYLKLIDRKPENNIMQYGNKPLPPDLNTGRKSFIQLGGDDDE